MDDVSGLITHFINDALVIIVDIVQAQPSVFGHAHVEGKAHPFHILVAVVDGKPLCWAKLNRTRLRVKWKFISRTILGYPVSTF